ncbi:hypothetical protein GNI_056250 [Gregarina niphandrodes]|uniref:Uncharacterized protein n=1 Tax=Gregarina niphandrodes TaxID=110365 RepID=A0A023B8S3_GRENI|nr:hypothetical protein GNI_056250 [Gregarina niphandrodes]EZG70302.1 hypothetical protein GNI_056250 [Gregarina niphandrodes]|eukprot:XP_011129964.1 hypothetical protein GNI_056250 [Gregarina niphandrodes]
MFISPSRSSSSGTALVAALTVFHNGTPALANTAGHRALHVELLPRSEKASKMKPLKVKVAVPCVPSDLKNFNIVEDCNAIQIVRGPSSSDRRAIEFGASLLGEVWHQICEGMGPAMITREQHEACQKVLQALGASMFSEWGDRAEDMSAAAEIPLFTYDDPFTLPRVEDAWAVVKADDLVADSWSDSAEPSTRSWSELLCALGKNKIVLGLAFGTALTLVMARSAFSTPQPESIVPRMSPLSTPQPESIVPPPSTPQPESIVPSKYCGPNYVQYFARPSDRAFTQICEDSTVLLENLLAKNGCRADARSTCAFLVPLCNRFWAANGRTASVWEKAVPGISKAGDFNHVFIETDEQGNFAQVAVNGVPPSCMQ